MIDDGAIHRALGVNPPVMPTHLASLGRGVFQGRSTFSFSVCLKYYLNMTFFELGIFFSSFLYNVHVWLIILNNIY